MKLVNFLFSVEFNESYEENENENEDFHHTVFSLSPQLNERIQDSSSLYGESHHTSLKRKKPEKGDSIHGSPVLEKSHSVQSDIIQTRPASMVVPSQSEANVSLSPSIGSLNRQVIIYTFISVQK